jgi:type III secretion system FlhB-like substrate exporter
MFLKLLKNAMIRNIKIHNILDIIEISTSMELNNCIIKKNYENVISIFPMIFQNLTSLKKSRCDIPTIP